MVSTALSMSATSLALVMPGRHWDFGWSSTVVSIIVSGAGSVEVSARPIFPNTLATSGNAFSFLSICWTIQPASRLGTPGSVVGMYRMEPSSISGRKSVGKRASNPAAGINVSIPAAVKAYRYRITARSDVR